MENTNDTQSAPAAPPAAPQIGMQRVYLKGTSVELPGSPQSFLGLGDVQISQHLDIQTGAVQLDESLFEVVVRVTLQLTRTEKSSEEKKLFALLEVDQAGIFEVRGATSENIEGILGIACPQVLYPFIRVNLADLMSRASLMPFYIPDINFAAVHEQQMLQARAKAQDTKVIAQQSTALH